MRTNQLLSARRSAGLFDETVTRIFGDDFKMKDVEKSTQNQLLIAE